MATQQDTSIEHELIELAAHIQLLLFLSEGNVSQEQLARYSDQLTLIIRRARQLGFCAAFTAGETLEWQAAAGCAYLLFPGAKVGA